MFILRISICIVLILSYPALSQENAVDRETDVIVMVAEGTVTFDLEMEAASINEASISDDLLTILQQFDARKIIRAI